MMGLIHSATITHTTAETIDSGGQPTPSTTTSATVACRFFQARDVIKASGQAYYGATQLKVMLPGTATVAEGDTIVTTTPGFVGTFRINSVAPAYARDPLVPHHYTCDIARAS